MNSLPVLFCFVFSLSSCLPRASRKEEKSKAVGGKKKKKNLNTVFLTTQKPVWRGPPRLWGPRNWSKGQREVAEAGSEGEVGKQASGVARAERKCLIPVSAVASIDPP